MNAASLMPLDAAGGIANGPALGIQADQAVEGRVDVPEAGDQRRVHVAGFAVLLLLQQSLRRHGLELQGQGDALGHLFAMQHDPLTLEALLAAELLVQLPAQQAEHEQHQQHQRGPGRHAARPDQGVPRSGGKDRQGLKDLGRYG